MCRAKGKGIHSRSCESKRNGRPQDPERSLCTTYRTMNSFIESTNIDRIHTSFTYVVFNFLSNQPHQYTPYEYHIYIRCVVYSDTCFFHDSLQQFKRREIDPRVPRDLTIRPTAVSQYYRYQIYVVHWVVKSIHISSHPPLYTSPCINKSTLNGE